MTTEAKFKYALKEMMLSKPLNEINVTLLCDKCSCHRQTFYYHYQDIYDLLAAIFLNEQIPEMDRAETPKTTLIAFLNYTKANFLFLRATYNSAAHDLVDDFFYGKIMGRLFNVFLTDKSIALPKDSCRVASRRYAKVVGDEFGYAFRDIDVTPLRFERGMKRFIDISLETILPGIIACVKKEKNK